MKPGLRYPSRGTILDNVTIKALPLEPTELQQRLHSIAREHDMTPAALVDALEQGTIEESPALIYAVMADAALRLRATAEP
jgi:hypothetical protein